MAPGFFNKVKGFFSKVGSGIKKAAGTVGKIASTAGQVMQNIPGLIGVGKILSVGGNVAQGLNSGGLKGAGQALVSSMTGSQQADQYN